MVDAVKLPSAERVDLAARLGQRLAGSPLIGGDRDGLEVGEIFHVDVLKSSGLAGRGPARRMGTRARQAPYLHVQVRRDRSAIFAAHVTKGDDDDWEIGELPKVVGLPGTGVAGFRKTHTQAVHARRAARVGARAPAAIVNYPDVSLLALASADLDHARELLKSLLQRFTTRDGRVGIGN